MADFTVNITNTNAGIDGQAARYIVALENERRAALDPPGTPLPLTPAGDLVTSYETVLAATVAAAHASYIIQAGEQSLQTDARDRWKISTDAQRTAALAALQPIT